ncbi:hypothetical protein JXC34_00855 [Candidatus Woesearchaeota archaeon]|nr:hypothetical protein [Candidatus Woesearchaeota archaeon]
MKEAHTKYLVLYHIFFIISIILSIVFVIASNYPGKMPVKQCFAEDAAASPGTWGDACENTYPGDSLFYDDSTYETHAVRNLAGSGFWAGVKINSSNSSITDCARIVNVSFCYKWWSQTAVITSCDISVDADDGASYTEITTACPGISEPSAITCVDVTSLEDWSCGDFWGSGAMAKSELVHAVTGAPGYYNITWDVFFFNVTYSNETLPPVVSLITPVDTTSTSNNNQTFTCNTSGTGLSNFTLFLWNSTGIYQTISLDVSGSYNKSSFLVQNITDGTYEWNCIAYDSTGKSGEAAANYSIYVNTSMPELTIMNLAPVEGASYDISEDIEIGADVTSPNSIETVYVNITYPDASSDQLSLSGTGNWYSTSFTIPEQIGTYYLDYYAKDSLGEEETESTYFAADDLVDPTIIRAQVGKTILYINQQHRFQMDTTDNLEVDTCWFEVTLPDMSTDTDTFSCVGVPYLYSNTAQLGNYTVEFFVNDTAGNEVSTFLAFQVWPKVDFDIEIEVDSGDVNLTFYKNEDTEVVYSDTLVGEDEIALPETDLDVEFKSHSNRFKTKLRKVNVLLEDNKTMGLDKHTEESDYLVTYGVENEYSFEDATVTIYYDDLSFSQEANLELFKCDNYDFDNRNCLSSWYEITSSATQNTAGNYFEFTTTSFSGFSIREYVPPVVETETPSNTVSSSSTPSSNVGVAFTWDCGEWSECIDGKETRECIKYNSAGDYVLTEDAERACQVDIVLPEKKPYDITIIMDELLKEESDKLNIVLLLENFQDMPITLDVDLAVYDIENKEIMRDVSSVTVEEILWRDYSSLDALPDGKYTVIVEVLYDITAQRFVKEIEIGARSPFKEFLAQYSFLNWTTVLAFTILLVVTASYIYFNRKVHLHFHGKE